MKKNFGRISLMLLLILVLGVSVSVVQHEPHPVYAATFVVDNPNDAVDINPGDGICDSAASPSVTQCTLRAAIMEANAFPGSDIIQLPAGTYTLTITNTAGDEEQAREGDLDIRNGSVTIIGADEATTIINANDIDRVFDIIGAELEIREVTVQGGAIAGDGGGVYNDVGTFTMRNSTLQDNTATNGGGIYNRFGTVSILDNSTIGNTGNANTATGDGGGIFSEYNAAGAGNVVTIDRSTVQFNTAGDDGAGMFVTDDGDLVITNTTISNNDATGAGGGIFVADTTLASATVFTISDSVVDNNTAVNGAGGIQIHDVTAPTITNTDITNNTSTDSVGGLLFTALLANNSVTLDITGSLFDNNDSTNGIGAIGNGVGLVGTGATINMLNTTVRNSDGGSVGAIYNEQFATVNITLSTISGNNATGTGSGGALNNRGTANILESTLSGNSAAVYGGAIFNRPTGVIDINRSTISGNNNVGGGALGGGGIANNGGSIDIDTSTISGNTTAVSGGGIANVVLSAQNGLITVRSSTIAFNGADVGGGLFNETTTTSLSNTILSNNTATTTGADCRATSGVINSNGGLIVQDAAVCANDITFLGGIPTVSGSPAGLQPLANNGGPTFTHRLNSDSIAIDAGADCAIDPLPPNSVDQRGTGFSRPINISTVVDEIGSDGCDVGAFEVQSLENAIIGNFVFDDINANGIQDPGEPGIANFPVILLDGSGTTTLATTNTDANGFYTFTVPPAGAPIQVTLPATFTIAFDLPTAITNSVVAANAEFTLQNVGGDETDSDADRTSGRVVTPALNGGDTNLSFDAGIITPGNIGDFVFEDTNGNGIQDGGELGIAGVIVRLRDSGGALIEETVSADGLGADPLGFYGFSDIQTGDYFIEFVIPAATLPNYIFTLQDAGLNDDVDSDADPISGETDIFTLSSGTSIVNIDAGIYQLGALNGFVWDDVNGDGLFQIADESPVQGVRVDVRNTTTGLIDYSIITDANGLYSFTTVLPGTYDIEFVLLAPFDSFTLQDANSNGNDDIDSDVDRTTGILTGQLVQSATTLDNISAGIYQSVTIEGVIFNDADADGVNGAGDTPFTASTVTIQLRDGLGNILNPPAPVNPDPTDGTYQFANLVPGSYIVEVIPPAGRVFSEKDVNNNTNDTIDSDFFQNNGFSDVLTLTSGQTLSNIDAGLQLAAALSGTVWVDQNVNGLQDGVGGGGEPGQSNVTVRIFALDGITLIAETVTDGSGNYSFASLPAGQVILAVTPPSTRGFTAQDAGSDAIDSDVNQYTGRSTITIAAPGGGTNDYDIGLVDAFQIGNFVFEDLDADGIQDTGLDPGLPGVQIQLLSSTEVGLATTQSSPTGNYAFYLTPGLDYIIEFTLPTGFTFTPANQGGDDLVDSDAVENTATTSRISFTATAADNSLDAGFYQLNSVSGTVFDDTDADGLRDPGELGRNGVTVTLLDGAGAPLSPPRIATTASGGTYTFSNLPAGDYIIAVTPPTNTTFTAQDVNMNMDDSRDSDVVPNTGRLNFTLTSNQDSVFDAGLIPGVSISGTIFTDLDVDGLQDGGPEIGIQGVTINLYRTLGGEALLGSTISDANGDYIFTITPNATYIIEVVLPTGFRRVPQDVGGNDAIDSDTSQTNGRVTVVVEAIDVDIDAGLEPLALIGDFVFEDTNANGVQDGGEPGVQGVVVNLLDGTGNPLSPPQSTTTDVNGNYTFVDLVASNYIVEFIAPAGRFFTTQNNGGAPGIGDDSNPDPSTGRTPSFALATGEQNRTIDAGLQAPARIGGFVFNDTNADGIQDAGETGRSGVTVNLLDGTGNPLSPPQTTTTDGTGNYVFTDLQAGDYIVEVLAPLGFAFTLQNQGGDDALDSDVGVNGRTAVLTLSGGQQLLNEDAGLVAGTGIGDFVFNDLDQDGIQDAGEPGVDGVTVNLRNSAGTTILDTQVTAGGGAYAFSALLPGTYIIEVVLPTGATSFSPQDQGGNEAVDSDVDPAAGANQGRTAAITIVQGVPNNDIDAGIIFPISVQVYFWEDIDGDGIQDAEDIDGDGIPDTGETAGLAGGTVELFRAADGSLVGTVTPTTNAADPNVVFNNLAAGTYYIVATAPTGFAISPVDQGIDDTLDSDANTATGRTPDFTLTGGQTLTNVDIGAFTATTIGGQVFIDTNENGLQDGGEVGYNGLTVNLYRVAGGETLINTVVTAGGGLYAFGVPDGTYIIEFVDPGASISFAPQNVGGDDAIDSDPSVLNGRTVQFTVPGGGGNLTDLNNIDAGLIQSGSEPLVVTKSFGTTATPPLAPDDTLSWVICARNVNLNEVDGVVVTDDVDLAAQQIDGAFYGIGSACPTGVPTTPDFDISSPTAVPAGNISSDGLVTTPTIDDVPANAVVIVLINVTIIEPGQTNVPSSPESGVLAMSSIMLLLGLLFQPLLKRPRLAATLLLMLALLLVLAPLPQTYADNTTDVSIQATQQAQNGRWVRIDSNDPAIQQVGSWTTIDNQDAIGGSFLYSEDPTAALTLNVVGTQVRVQLPLLDNNAAMSVFAGGQQVGLIEDYGTTDSLSFTSSPAFTLPIADEHIIRLQSAGYSLNDEATSPVLVFDAIDVFIPVEEGAEELSNLTGIVWQDTNGNDLLDGSDLLIEGIAVDLYLDFGSNDRIIQTSITDENGRYMFTGLLDNNYFIVVDRESVPDDLDPASVNWSPIEIRTPFDGGDIIIPNGSGAPSYNQFGGTTAIDTDRDSAFTDADAPIGGVTVNLYVDDGDRVFDPGPSGDFIINTTTSEDDGSFLFDTLLSGTYWVEVDTTNLPAEADPNQLWRLLWVNVPEISSANLLLVPAPETFTVDGNAYIDNNYNRQVDPNDSPLAGLTLQLFYDNGDGFFNANSDELVTTVVSAEDGTFVLESTLSGVHWLMPDMDNLPAGVAQDQVWPPMWIRLPAITESNVLLLPAPAVLEDDEPYDFNGNGILTGIVFNDDNGNRSYDSANESGIAEAVVRLFLDNGDGERNDADGEISITETDGNGVYTFEGLVDGNYWVELVESSLPANYMDTVGYGGHGDQNPAEFSLVGANEASSQFVTQGPDFAYALDTDHDGSPDGREGAGDRDNDNIPNYLDGYDPTGVVYGADILGNTIPLIGVEVSLVYRSGDELLLADTIQPNPQITGSNGEYRFDLVASDEGLPTNGSSRTFELVVEGVDENQVVFPSENYPDGGTYRLGGNNGQVAPFNSPDPSEEYYLSFEAQLGSDDIVNNNPVGDVVQLITPDITNEGCAIYTGSTQVCDTAEVNYELTVSFSLSPLTDTATGLATEEIVFTHTLTNDGAQPDSYRITLTSTDPWTQSLRILDGVNLLGTINAGGSFDTRVLNPAETLTLELTVTVPSTGIANGDFNNFTITATSIDSIALGAEVSESAVDTVTVDGGCIQGTVYNDGDDDSLVDPGEGLDQVRLTVFDQSGGVAVPEVRTDTNGFYQVGGLAAGTYTVQVDQGTLPGQATFLTPNSNSQSVSVTVSETCTVASFRLQVTVNPTIAKTASTSSALPNETVTFSITVANPTGTTISGVTRTIVLTDPVSTASFTNVSVTQPVVPPGVIVGAASVNASQIVTLPITSLGPNTSFTLQITATILETVTRGSNISNTARIDIDSSPVAQATATILVPLDTTTDTDGDGVPDVSDPDPTDPTVTGAPEDFGTGGTTDPATGSGETVADPDPDTLPQTGYMPIEYFTTNDESSEYQTAALSPIGRIVIGLVGLLALAMAFILFRFYNDSEMLYEWMQQRKGMGAAILGVIILSFLLGSFSLLYTANDIAGVVDVDNVLGIDNEPSTPNEQADNVTDGVNVDGGNTAPTGNDPFGYEARNSATSDDLNGVTWVENGVATPLPTLPTFSDDSQFVIPSLNLFTKLVNAPVVGTTWDVSHFFDEVAFLEGTTPPGVEGNTVIAGHVTHTRGLGPFRTLDQVQIGEEVIVRDYDIEYTYIITELRDVSADDVWVTDDITNGAMLTLITCSGWNPNTRTYATRLVVRAELDKWRIVGEDENAFEQPLGERSRYEIEESGVDREGEWVELGSFNTSNGSYFYSEDKDATASFVFSGDKFRISYMMFNNFGEFEVYLDGELIMTVDAYSPASGYSSTGVIQVEPGTHRIEIRNTDRANPDSKGNIIGIDAIDIWG